MSKVLYHCVSLNQLLANVDGDFVKIFQKPHNAELISLIVTQDYKFNQERYKKLFINHLLFMKFYQAMNDKHSKYVIKMEGMFPNFVINTINLYKQEVSQGFIPIEAMDSLQREVNGVDFSKYPDMLEYANTHWCELRDKVYTKLAEIINSVRCITLYKDPSHLDDEIILKYRCEDYYKYKMLKKYKKEKGITNIIKGILVYETIGLEMRNLDYFLSLDLFDLFRYIQDPSHKNDFVYYISKYNARNLECKGNNFYKIGELKEITTNIKDPRLDKYVLKHHLEVKKK